ncbi:hypothetical protein AB9P05_06835 [Roseivirga sp. BDSF3-8]|uniref:hypothetical protein n=1 Tax=Roseivirga sp. BDSF3-8 TaxID=3241598 RepID=UPI0035321792
MSEEFVTYLTKKRIDAEVFFREEPHVAAEWERLFMQMHPDSFTAQKLFLINGIRRQFPLSEESGEKPAATKKSITPKIKRS